MCSLYSSILKKQNNIMEQKHQTLSSKAEALIEKKINIHNYHPLPVVLEKE
jgi:hypothetical protein